MVVQFIVDYVSSSQSYGNLSFSGYSFQDGAFYLYNVSLSLGDESESIRQYLNDWFVFKLANIKSSFSSVDSCIRILRIPFVCQFQNNGFLS